MEKKDGAKCDPGWNDPPLFSYETHTAQLKASKPRTFLNKRVAFPLHGASPPTSSSPPVDPTAPLSMSNLSKLPPPPMGTFTPPKETPMRNEACLNENSLDSSQLLRAVMTNLCDILDSAFQDEEKDKAEIQRRLDILRKMWTDDKLCQDVQQKIFALSKALKDNEVEKADDLQKCLMVDHASSCSPWMSGVRQLIHHQDCSMKSDDVTADQEVPTMPDDPADSSAL
ncbi:steroid receptor RNA activator 1 [Macrosteles quadrilineatus]|uniref:steroid receptor RNA activator 1 n=1 Tax=Macrosteles quadrilineatus TaxID=74068 RepID=UPI0023E1C15F|nr:steroid receptor RNA activator 1 [Macrosteles quadrilineatus]